MRKILPKINVGVFNPRSLCNKTAGTFELLLDRDIDICLLSETWLRKGDTSKLSEIKDFGYNLHHQSRPGRGGGVAVAYKRSLDVSKRNTPAYKSFEHLECVLKSPSNSLIRLISVYRSCTAKLSNIADFLRDFDDFLDSLTHLPGKVIIAGDFNIHVEDPSNVDAIKFMSLLSNYDFTQHVKSCTHISGGTLDLILTRENAFDSVDVSSLICEQSITTSDHYFIHFSCSFSHERGPHRTVRSGRKIKDIDLDMFKHDLLQSDISNPDMYVDCESATLLYNRELERILDKHAPLTEFNVTLNQSKWMNTACQTARTKRRKAERDHKRLNTEDSKNEYRKAYKHADTVINETRNSYYRERLNANTGNKKETYKIVNQLLDRDLTKDIRPNNKPEAILCEEMKNYFKEKVDTIYNDIEECTTSCIPPSDDVPDFKGDNWSQFKPVDESMLKKVLSDLNKKECEEDPIPVKLLLQCIDEVKNILLFIINQSLFEGVFPSDIKTAVVRPAIKDQNGDPNFYKNYRPISNLPFLSKILEKCVQEQLSEHLQAHELHAEYQSGYRINRSCETATLAIYNDLLCISDARSKVILLMLDLSAAFDTVCHEVLLKKLHKKFGLAGKVYEWFKSYLDGRSFSVTINRSKSGKCMLRIGVPQGSILGPILFILYTKDINFIAEKHGFNIHMYADDSQLYIEFNPLFQDINDVEEKIILCLQEIKDWMLSNKLKLNPEKTEVLTVQSRNNHHTWSLESLDLNNSGDSIEPSAVVKSLGVRFDTYLTFDDHVQAIVQECNRHLRNLRVIASKLSYELKRQLVHCLIFSKLDYCNGLLYGLPDSTLRKLQKIQNSCVRFLFGTENIEKWDSVTPFLKEAHFLPVKQRIDFKIGLTAYKCLNNIAPKYLSDCISVKSQPTKSLRTDEDYFLLDVPPIPNLKRTERSFKYCAPEVWNKLPYEVRSCSEVTVFKQKLKTHLFIKAFDGS